MVDARQTGVTKERNPDGACGVGGMSLERQCMELPPQGLLSESLCNRVTIESNGENIYRTGREICPHCALDVGKILIPKGRQMPMKNYDLDRFDHAILKRLQENNTTPLRILSREINLSTAAVQRRVRLLEELGVIQANVAVVDPTRIG